MIKDITFGQFFPVNSVLHRMDARFKMVMTFGLIVVIFCALNFYSLLLLFLFSISIMIMSGVPIKMYLRSFKAIIFFVALTAVLNLFYITGGNLLFSWWIFNVYSEGVFRAVFVAIRILLLIIISAALTYTTSPTSLADAIESLLKPLTLFKIDTHTFAMMMTIALRFIPTLIEETDRIMSAQKARGADMDTGGIIARIKAVLPILIPLLASSIRRATELADAMECRCYHGGKGRTRLNVMKASGIDFIASACCIMLFCGVILLNIFF